MASFSLFSRFTVLVELRYVHIAQVHALAASLQDPPPPIQARPRTICPLAAPVASPFFSSLAGMLELPLSF